ncbi:putative Myb-like protein A [Ophiobolus disseminans]|uniref:Putative Myb-like protein A n=1 Tax=Ophiobolus disseminans TaxID=1469910 RepID=A0A6A7AHR8_9PLEO|nr:putative Myb-like protein A [Ophiobolus disseminans]
MVRVTSSKRQPKVWVPEEDDVLRNALRNATAPESSVNWHHVAAQIPGRTNKDCRKRWVYALSPNISKGSWEPDEDGRLRDAVHQHGTKWAIVSRLVLTRNGDQCSRRWHENLKPNINRARWSLLEVFNTSSVAIWWT